MNNLPKAGPWATRAEFLIDQALDNALAGTPAQIRAMRPAARPQELFPARTGYQTQPWDINTVLNIDRLTPTFRSWVSGMPVENRNINDAMGKINGSSRNSMSENFR